MARKAQGVKGQVQIAQRSVGPLHIVAQHPVVVWDVLDHRAHALELGMGFQPFQHLCICGVFEIHPTHHAFDKV